jgi:hypothetical protein
LQRWRAAEAHSRSETKLMKQDREKTNDPAGCKHARTRLVAKDQDTEYVECLECGAILEGEELQKEKSPNKEGFDGSLSDA